MKSTTLTTYLTAGVAAAAVGQADAATIVTFYGAGAQNPASPGFNPAVPNGINFGSTLTPSNEPTFYVDIDSSNNSIFAGYDDGNTILDFFTSGSDFATINFSGTGGYYFFERNGGGPTYRYGSTNGSANYANISFDGDDGVYEAVAQFFFDDAGTGYLIAIAENDDDTALSISAGKAAIDAIPEPTTVGLLSMGAAGLAMLRRKKKAA